MELILPQWGRSLPGVGVLATTRPCGISQAPYGDGAGGGGLNLGLHVGDAVDHVVHNRAQVRRHFPAEPVWLNQVHGTAVIDAGAVQDSASHDPVTGDASFTTKPGVVLAIMTADCLPVLFADTAGKVVAAAHAGWRGLAGGVLDNTVMSMRLAGAIELHAWLGPAIGPAHFEVGGDVLQAFVAKDEGMRNAFRAIDGRPDKYLADIYQLARMTLKKVGVEHISGGNFCTVSAPERFYSYRRDGVTGRMASFIWLR